MKNIICIFLACSCYINVVVAQSFSGNVLEESKKQAAAMAITKEFRGSQKGMLISAEVGCGGFFSLGKFSREYKRNSKGLATSLGLKVSYVKESFLPLGVFAGFGFTNVFYNTRESNTSSINEVGFRGFGKNNADKRYPFFDIGISKNIGTTFTYQLGYRHIFSGEKTEDYPLYYEEQAGISHTFILRQKKSFFSVGCAIYWPYYKEHNYMDSETLYTWDEGYVESTYLATETLGPNFMYFISYGHNF